MAPEIVEFVSALVAVPVLTDLIQLPPSSHIYIPNIIYILYSRHTYRATGKKKNDQHLPALSTNNNPISMTMQIAPTVRHFVLF